MIYSDNANAIPSTERKLKEGYVLCVLLFVKILKFDGVGNFTQDWN